MYCIISPISQPPVQRIYMTHGLVIYYVTSVIFYDHRQSASESIVCVNWCSHTEKWVPCSINAAVRHYTCCLIGNIKNHQIEIHQDNLSLLNKEQL